MQRSRAWACGPKTGFLTSSSLSGSWGQELTDLLVIISFLKTSGAHVQLEVCEAPVYEVTHAPVGRVWAEQSFHQSHTSHCRTHSSQGGEGHPPARHARGSIDAGSRLRACRAWPRAGRFGDSSALLSVPQFSAAGRDPLSERPAAGLSIHRRGTALPSSVGVSSAKPPGPFSYRSLGHMPRRGMTESA